MSVNNGDIADENTFNDSFMSREEDTSTVGKLDLENTDVASGSSIINVQKNVNALYSLIGEALNSGATAVPAWLSDIVGAPGDTHKARIEALVALFLAATGHTHDDTDGNGPAISAENLADINNFWSVQQTFSTAGITGTSTDVSAELVGKFAGGGSAVAGVLTDPSNNRVSIIDSSAEDQFEDTDGTKVYGRLTEAAGTWTVTYYTNKSGVETSYNFLASSDLKIIFREVFNQDTRPTIQPDSVLLGSLDVTADIVDATASQRGVVSTGAQTLAGAKTLQDSLALQNTLLGAIADDASTGASQTLSTPATTLVRLTSGTLSSVTGVTAPAGAQVFMLLNRTGSDVNILNELGTSANQIITGTEADLELPAGAALILAYDSTTAKWQIVGGSGGAGGGAIVSPAANTYSGPLTIADTGSINPNALFQRQLLFVKGTTSSGGITVGEIGDTSFLTHQEVWIMGTDSADPVVIEETTTNIHKLNGQAVLGDGSILKLIYNAEAGGWIETGRSN